ncbi:hypothetical protein Tco_0820736, partial [Tanacetum coccineum]
MSSLTLDMQVMLHIEILVMDEGADGDVTSNAFSDTHRFDSRSYGGSISGKEVQADLGENIMENLYVNAGKGNNVSQGVNANVFMSVNDEIGPILVPISENPLLSSRVSPGVSPRILRRGEVLVDGGSKINATFSFNNVEKWPNLSNVNDVSGSMDEVMNEAPIGKKHVSFVNVVQGLSKFGNNKLKLILVCMNDQGKRVVDVDPLVEKGSKNWNMTLVGYFVGLKMSHREIIGHLRRMWRAYHLDEVIMNDCGLYFLKFKSDK